MSRARDLASNVTALDALASDATAPGGPMRGPAGAFTIS